MNSLKPKDETRQRKIKEQGKKSGIKSANKIFLRSLEWKNSNIQDLIQILSDRLEELNNELKSCEEKGLSTEKIKAKIASFEKRSKEIVDTEEEKLIEESIRISKTSCKAIIPEIKDELEAPLSEDELATMQNEYWPFIEKANKIKDSIRDVINGLSE